MLRLCVVMMMMMMMDDVFPPLSQRRITLYVDGEVWSSPLLVDPEDSSVENDEVVGPLLYIGSNSTTGTGMYVSTHASCSDGTTRSCL